ncbi:hypothetical protein [Candidatus Anaplasma sp. TIGMIC]|uniref:hypothetical protein n=1 Tax=Candidatus Anaplasma sp. TIGMIC TaxID=3020713 RepID=UPI00232B9DC4|nr:hypothetical protein [Candidatus Anaplasma sp. TIGMIC]MDB1135715.1 hypothetical protein [Candidatus Anaplasma sp. TIGMIC]
MDRRVAMSVAAVATYAVAVVALSCAVSTGVRRGFGDHVSTALIVLSAFLVSTSAYILYRITCRDLDDDHAPDGFYVTAFLEPPGVNRDDIAVTDGIDLHNCRVLKTTAGRGLGISPGSYTVHAGALPRYRVRRSNSVAYKVRFRSPVDEMYFRLVLDRKLSMSNMLGGNPDNISMEEVIGRIIAVEPHDEYLLFSMQADFRDHMAEYILYSMATSEKLSSGEGIKFYRFFCYCCMGLAYPPSPSQDKLIIAKSDSVFSEFPGSWFAIHEYKQVFLNVIAFSRDAWGDRKAIHASTCRYLSEREVIFLEKLIAGVDAYSVSKQEKVLAEKSLTHMLVMMYAVLAPAKCRVFYREDIKSWLYGIMMSDKGRREAALHVAMSSFGRARFNGTLLSDVYFDLCSESGSKYKIMRSHMADLATVSSDNVTSEQLSDVLSRKGREFFALCSIMVPYFYKTRAHRTLLTTTGYVEVLAGIRLGLRNFNGTLISSLQEGTILSTLSYHVGAKPFTGNTEEPLDEYIVQKNDKICSMIERFKDLEYICGCAMWKDPTVLRFFVHLAVWMWDAKELCLLRKEKPLHEKTCTVPDIIRRYIHAYWGNLGTDVLVKREDYYNLPVKTMFSDSIRIDFRASPCKETLQVSRGILTDIVCRCVRSSRAERIASS